MAEVRQTPVPSTHTRVDIWPDSPALEFVLCDSLNSDGTAWECCTRDFLRRALDDLKSETGLELLSAFEHEFAVVGDLPPAPPFSVEAVRNAAQLAHDIAVALDAAGLAPETVEPEYGIRQYEVTVAPSLGLAGGDQAVITREVIRECARQLGLRGSFSPKPYVDGVGNGAHVHFSFVDETGQNATYDPSHPSGASAVARAFIAGVVRHMPAMCALLAPSPVSYLRLGPHHWSCGYAAFGIQNREASIRICPSTSPDPASRARGFNLELRPPDASANPYLVLGALVRAGLSGIRAGLDLPPACDVDPSDLTDEQREEMGILPLPGSLPEAIDLMLADDEVCGWMSPTMLESYLGVKRLEQELTTTETPEETATRYREAY
jgi:glutamine synthetase